MFPSLSMNWMHSACLPQAPLHVTPKIDYVDPSVTQLSTTWRYRRLSSKNQIQNYTVTLNTSLTRPTTRCHLNIPLSHFVSNTNKPKHHESCSTKSKPYSKLQIKNFRCCVVKAKFRNSFVVPKKYSAKQITISPNTIEVKTYFIIK